MTIKILQYNIFSETKEELIHQIDNYEKVHIVSGNPQILFQVLKNEFLLNNFNSKNSIIIPDGIGTVICSKIVKQPVKEKVAGIEVMDEVIKKCNIAQRGIYLLGAKQEALDMCHINLHTKYPELNIVGTHDGFIDIDNCEDLLREIEETKPYALFVAMGCPRQELFIAKYMDRLPCKIYMGVGGSFDIIAGTLKRAPKWMINLGIEWLYRVVKEPTRIKRLSSIPKFIFMVIKDKFRN